MTSRHKDVPRRRQAAEPRAKTALFARGALGRAGCDACVARVATEGHPGALRAARTAQRKARIQRFILKSAMDPVQPNFFSGPYIDRRAEEREDAGWARAALEDPATLFILGSGTRHLVYTHPQPRIAFLEVGEAAVAAADHSRLVLLGWFRE